LVSPSAAIPSNNGMESQSDTVPSFINKLVQIIVDLIIYYNRKDEPNGDKSPFGLANFKTIAPILPHCYNFTIQFYCFKAP